MICSSVNRVRFIVRPQVGPDSNRIWRKNPGAGQRQPGDHLLPLTAGNGCERNPIHATGQILWVLCGDAF